MMKVEGIEFRAAGNGEMDCVISLLKGAGLPWEDIAYGRQDLIVAVCNGKIYGCIGLERYGGYGLLRSLAVEESCRGLGTGKALVGKVIACAKEAGVGELYLLTMTAEKFFERLGFNRIDRMAVPDVIKGTTEFESICPVSSVCMKKKF